MMDDERLSVRPLGPLESTTFMGFTFPAYRKRWAAGEPLVAVGLFADEAPIGLALATAPVDGHSELLSLFVAREHRGKGYAAGLIGGLEMALAEAGARVVTGTYVADAEKAPVVEHVLARSGWTPPVARMLMLQARLSEMRQARWLQNVAFENAYRIVPWVSLPEVDRENLRLWNEADGWIPTDLAPWLHEPDCEPETSLALYRDGRVVGWVLTHKLDGGVLRFSSGWVHPALQRRGRLFALYGESGDRAMALGYEQASWTVPLHHEGKAAFARRWMAPYARCRETRGSAKLLVQP